MWGGWFRSQYGVHGRAERGAESISGKNTVQPRMGGRFQKYQEISAEATPLNVKKKYSETAHKLAIFAPPPEYFEELFRISKNQIIWGGNYFNLPPTRCFIVWRKLQIPTHDFSMSCVEYAWTSFNKNALYCEFNSAGNSNYQRIHPTQKPVALYNWILNQFAKPGDKILDTHLGSGSSRIAAHEMGYDFMGTEVSGWYFAKQEERFKQETAQGSLFEAIDGKFL